jgi:hypothetical protein
MLIWPPDDLAPSILGCYKQPPACIAQQQSQEHMFRCLVALDMDVHAVQLIALYACRLPSRLSHKLASVRSTDQGSNQASNFTAIGAILSSLVQPLLSVASSTEGVSR